MIGRAASDVPRHLAAGRHRRLAAIYLHQLDARADAEAITRASAAIDRVLEHDPASVGESRAHGERVVVIDPLTITFEAFADEGIVLVSSLHLPAPH